MANLNSKKYYMIIDDRYTVCREFKCCYWRCTYQCLSFCINYILTLWQKPRDKCKGSSCGLQRIMVEELSLFLTTELVHGDSSSVHWLPNPCIQKDQPDKTQQGLLCFQPLLPELARYFKCSLMTTIKHLLIGTYTCLHVSFLLIMYMLGTKRTWWWSTQGHRRGLHSYL